MFQFLMARFSGPVLLALLSALLPLKARALDNSVDPWNMGKGDWIWQMPASQTAVGANSVQELIDYEKARGMQWLTVKCGDGGSIWTQFNSDLITRAHNAGMKIF